MTAPVLAETEAALRARLAANPLDDAAWAGLAQMARALRDYGSDSRFLRYALACDPASLTGWYGVFAFRLAVGAADAVGAARRLTHIAPASVDFLNDVALLAEDRKVARRALALDPARPALLHLLPGLAWSRRALALAPQDAAGWRLSALKQDAATAGAAALRMALTLDPAEARAAVAYGTAAAAIDWQARGLRLEPLAAEALDDAAPTPPPTPAPTGRRLLLLVDTGFTPGAGAAHASFGRAAALAGHEVLTLALVRRRNESVNARAVLDAVAAMRPDAVLIGNVHGAKMDPAVLGEIAARWPAAFVLHDHWALTGRCTYVGDCPRHAARACDQTCPSGDAYPFVDRGLISETLAAKRALFAAGRIALGADSADLARFADRTLGLAPGTVSPTLYGFDTALLRPTDRARARRLLGLPPDRKIILCAAAILSEARKGVDLFIGALGLLNRPDLLPVFVGEGSMAGDRRGTPVAAARFLGFQPSPKAMALAYAAADLFVGPSREECFGQTFVEAALCGTPAVGFAVGGVPEAIGDGISGRLVPRVAADALAEVLAELLDDRRRAGLAATARDWAAARYDFAASYRSLAAGIGRHLGLAPAATLPPGPPPQLPAPRFVRD